jgi:hypothetical protein
MSNQKKAQPRRRLSNNELRAISYIATLSLAAVALLTGVDSPVFWTFLGIAIGALYGQPGNR